MLRYVSHLLLQVSGYFAGWFSDRSETNFPVIQMAIAVLILTLLTAILAFWPYFWWLKYVRKRPVKKADAAADPTPHISE